MTRTVCVEYLTIILGMVCLRYKRNSPEHQFRPKLKMYNRSFALNTFVRYIFGSKSVQI